MSTDDTQGPVDATRIQGPVDATRIQGPVDATRIQGPVDATRIPRYAEPSTFARLPRLDEVSRADVTVMGVPFDSGVSYRPGARFGPGHIRAAKGCTSSAGLYGRRSFDEARMWPGPKRAPGR